MPQLLTEPLTVEGVDPDEVPESNPPTKIAEEALYEVLATPLKLSAPVIVKAGADGPFQAQSPELATVVVAQRSELTEPAELSTAIVRLVVPELPPASLTK